MTDWYFAGYEKQPFPVGSATVAYTGPGDILSFAHWYGFRAYSAATAGTKAIRVRGADTVESDINTLANGSLDAATLAAFIVTHGASTVVTIYDKVGTADLTNATAANQPTVTTNGPNSNYAATFASASSQVLGSSANFSAQAQPVFWYVLAKATTPGADQGIWMQDSGSYTTGLLMDWLATGHAGFYGGTSFDGGALSSGNWHSVQLLANGASSVSNIDGSETTGDVGTQGIPAFQLWLGAEIAAKFFNGNVLEIGAVAATVSAGNRTSLNSNVHAAYGGF